MSDWITLAILLTLAVVGTTLHVRRKLRERAARLDACDVIEWHALQRQRSERR